MKYDTKSIQKRKNSIEIAKKFLCIVLIIFIYNMVLLFISSIKQENGMSLFGYKAYIITTNSMEPSIYSGDVVIVKKCKENKLQKGDVITFWQDQELITHRIARIEEDAEETQEKQDTKKYITKGDNNNVEDEQKKTLNDIEGKVVLVIPKFGKIILSLENKIIFLVVILIILVLCFFKIQKQEKRENRREKKRIEDEKNREN